MILPKVPNSRLVTIRRGGSLTDADHHLLALWAADCAEHVLHHFEAVRPPRTSGRVMRLRQSAGGRVVSSG